MVKLVNLTPHNITIVDENCKPIAIIPRSGVVARVSQIRNPLYNLILDNGVEIPVVENTYGEVQGLPDPDEDTYYIVSVIVANAVKGKRYDVLYPDTGPGSVCRDENGRIVGVRFLVKP